jgi:beta-glucosidase
MSQESENFIHQLLAQMTLDEKIGQLHQVSPGNDLDLNLLRTGQVGSLLNASGALTGQGFSRSSNAEQINHLQQQALSARLSIPILFGRDVIHGFRTVFPIPLAQAASFNPDLAEQAAAATAREASATGIRWTFAPMLDIARDPRWGRVAEGNGEDPYLGAQMATALVRGYQGDDVSAPDRLVACAKHYVGYGTAEGGRDYEGGEVSEPTLRDVYLPPFQAAVRAGAGTIMSAFIDLNGIPATANHHLLTEILRNEWGFDGFVVSDWESIKELIAHGVAEDEAHAARLALHAGVDMDMVSSVYRDTLATSLAQGLLPITELDQAVLRILRIKQRAGLFDHPFTDPQREQQDLLRPEARQLAREFARQSIVLLKNQANLLPLQGIRRLLVTGPFVHAQAELFGTWTPDGRAEDATSLDEALRQQAPRSTELWFADSIDMALHMAHHTDAILLLLGEHPVRSGENCNVSDLRLPPGQSEILAALAELGKPIILVIFAGRPLALEKEIPLAHALLYAWHPGIEGAAALAEILFGQASPSARLPITFPRRTGQVPIYYNHKNSGRPVGSSDLFITRYSDLLPSPLFPFGYGLTYTHFSYDTLQLSSTTMRKQLQVRCTLTNRGERAGSEVVQLYLHDRVGSLTRPVRELKGFQRITLEPGQSQVVTFTLTEEHLAFTRGDGSYGAEPGWFDVWVAPNSKSGLHSEFCYQG